MTISYRIQTSLCQESKLLFHGIQVQFSLLNCGRTEIQRGRRNSWDRRRPASGPTPSLITAFPSSDFTLSLCRLDSSTSSASCQRLFWKKEPDFLSRTLNGLAKVRCPILEYWTLSWQRGHMEVWKFPLWPCVWVCVWEWYVDVCACVCMVGYGWE